MVSISKGPAGQRLHPWLLLMPALALLGALLIAPLSIMGAFTFFRSVDYGVDEAAFQFGNWYAFLTDPYYHFAIYKTARVALITTVVCVVIGYIPAYVIAMTRSPKRWLLMLLFILPFWISFVVKTMSWIYVLGARGVVNEALLRLGLIDAPLEMLYGEAAVVMGLVHFLLPFAILNIFIALEGIDRNAISAARTLGASAWRSFLEVTLPLSLPGVATGTLLVFVFAAGSYVTPMILGGPRDFMFGTLIYNSVMTDLNWPMGSTLALAFVLIIGCCVIVYNHFFGLDRLTRGLS